MNVAKKTLTFSDDRWATVKVRLTLPEPTVVVTVGKGPTVRNTPTLTLPNQDWSKIAGALEPLTESRTLPLSDGRSACVEVLSTGPEPTVVVTVGKGKPLELGAQEWQEVVAAVDECSVEPHL